MNTFLIIVLVVVTVVLVVIGGVFLAKKIRTGLASYKNMAKLYKQINQAKKPAMSKPKPPRKKKPKRRK